MANDNSSPPVSQSSSPASKGTQTPLSLDLSSIPPLINPSPPSNTLLITNLQDPSIFHPTHLLTIRDLINQSAPLHSWSPLKSFRRIVVSFYDIDSALRIRQILDGEAILGNRVRVYFGEPTPIEPIDQHLHAPQSQKMFFISPPPSPPFGWEMRNEGPPNKEVHADDLASALAKLHARPTGQQQEPASPISPTVDAEGNVMREGTRMANRQRSGSSTVVYHPQDHGDSPHLPAVMVEDTTASPGDMSPIGGEGGKILAHTARPPVELMADV
ncbi:MAG: hypothetical protein M1830_008560 [Pleopsidium flavum]|nr:MAG: hypothetical protein M1830_008560 [Pleopsidium flavum]